MEYDFRRIQFNLIDTAGIYISSFNKIIGSEEYDNVRCLSYPNVDIFLLTFSIGSMKSLKSIQQKWNKEIQSISSKSIKILVGTKNDLKDDLENEDIEEIVTDEVALKVAKQLKCSFYHQCSALTQDGLNELFEKMAKIYCENNKDEKTIPPDAEENPESINIDKEKYNVNCCILM